MHNDNFVYFFPICTPSLSLSCLTALAGIFGLKKCPFPDLRGKKLFFINDDFNSRFFIETFYRIDDILFYSEFTKFFIMKEYWIFPNAEINKYNEIIIHCFSFTVLKDELQWLLNVKPILHSWDKNYLVMTNHPFCCSSITQSCLTLCNPMDCSTPGFPVLHHLPEIAQTQVHWVSDAIQPSCPLSSPCPSAFNLSQHQGLFKRVSSSHQVAKVLEFQLQSQSFRWLFRTDFL